MKDFKKTAVIIACVVLLCGQTVWAVAIPMLPYIPPTDAHIWGYIYNALGVTALGDDVIDKAEKYWNVYASVVNGANSALYEDMKQVFEKAKTGRSIVLTPVLSQAVQSVAHKATTEGIITDSVPSMSTWVPYEEVIQWADINTAYLTQSSYTRFCNTCDSKFGAGNWAMCAFAGNYGSSMEPLLLYGYNKEYVMKPKYNGIYQDRGYRIALFPNGIDQTYETVEMTFSYRYVDGTLNLNFPFAYLTNNWGTLRMWKNWGAQTVTTTLNVQSASITNALLDGIDLILTAKSTIVNGELDDTKNIVIDLPTSLPIPAIRVEDIPSVQDELGVLPLPLTEDVVETVTQLQEQSAIKYGDTGAYSVDLTAYFPFCIPFDLVRIITALDAEPEAPHITFPLPSDVENGKVIFSEYEFSLEWMSPVMVWVRRGELILGGIGIMLATRNVIRG